MADKETSNKKPKRRACAQSKKSIKRKTWYYREGEYFANKRVFKEWKVKKLEEKKKAEAAEAPKA
ncbi:MAG: hypothetical protein ACD_79C00337G0004 [uncultured bacterium]|nr:MAG: hypothetical protein ACD_79C00337G0004 [uncultured bacterium]